MTFQIKESYGNQSFGFSYFESDVTDQQELEKLAVEKVRSDWAQIKSVRFALHNPKPAFPTIEIREWDTNNDRKVRGGIFFKKKWR